MSSWYALIAFGYPKIANHTVEVTNDFCQPPIKVVMRLRLLAVNNYLNWCNKENMIVGKCSELVQLLLPPSLQTHVVLYTRTIWYNMGKTKI